MFISMLAYTRMRCCWGAMGSRLSYVTSLVPGMQDPRTHTPVCDVTSEAFGRVISWYSVKDMPRR